MAISFKTEVINGIMYVKTKGKDENLQEVQEYGTKLFQEAVKSNCTKVLCDETELIYDLELFDTFQLGKYLSEFLPSIAKVAIVCHPDFVADAQFWETVVVNRGLSVKMCNTIDEAENWLKA